MRIIVITEPCFLPGEADAVASLLDAGAWRVHLRKPGADENDMRRLLAGIPEKYRMSISLHDCHELAVPYGVGGVHVNSRCPKPPEGYEGLVSCSCHSLPEVSCGKGRFDYMFLSPVFDSISKKGYCSRFSIGELKDAAVKGIVDDRVFALGGVSSDNIGLVREAGFGGAAVLGSVWGQYGEDGDAVALVRRLESMLK